MQPFKTLQAKRVFFFPPLLPLKTRNFLMRWSVCTMAASGSKMVVWGHSWRLVCPHYTCHSTIPAVSCLLSSLFSRGWKNNGLKYLLKAIILIWVKTAYKLLSSLFDPYYPGIPCYYQGNTIFYSVHSLFTQLSIQPLDPCWLHTAIRSYRLRPVPGHEFKFTQSPDGKSHDC